MSRLSFAFSFEPEDENSPKESSIYFKQETVLISNVQKKDVIKPDSLRTFGKDLKNLLYIQDTKIEEENYLKNDVTKTKEVNQKAFKFRTLSQMNESQSQFVQPKFRDNDIENQVPKRVVRRTATNQKRITYSEPLAETILPCDIAQKDDPQYVVEYVSDIFKYLRENEKNLPVKDYMFHQNDINSKHRAILINWLVDVHFQFGLKDETLFLTVNLIDRYLSCVTISMQDLQLVGIAAVLISSKFEEIYCAESEKLIDMTDNSYTKEELFLMEGNILNALGFKLNVTSSLTFLDRYSKVHGISQSNKTYMVARYLLELALVDYKMVKYAPSKIAVSALCFACKLTNTVEWSDTLAKVSQYNQTEIIPCLQNMTVMFLEYKGQTNLRAVREKFGLPRYGKVSQLF